MDSKSKTTIHNIEPEFELYVISLAPELVSLALGGKKVKTYRYGDKYDYLKVKDKVKIIDTVTQEFVMNALIIGKSKQEFKDLPINILGHESYESKEHQREVFSGYYSYLGRPIRDNDNFTVLEFEKI